MYPNSNGEWDGTMGIDDVYDAMSISDLHAIDVAEAFGLG